LETAQKAISSENVHGSGTFDLNIDNIVGLLHIDTGSYVAVLCCIETVKSVVPPGSRGRNVFKTPKRLVDDNREKAVCSVRAVGVPDVPSSRCTGRTPWTEHSARQTKNASSLRTRRHGSALTSFSSLTASRQCHGVRSAGMSDRQEDTAPWCEISWYE